MRTSVPGSKPRRTGGFTLIELMVVVALIAIATALVGLSLRDPQQAQLEREAERLVALLETARAEARAGGLTVRWRPATTEGPNQFEFLGLPQRIQLPQRWLGDAVTVDLDGNRHELQLGPEPLLPAQSMRLRLGQQQLRVATDGLRPFAIQP
jgi:general secretion pathway protein H